MIAHYITSYVSILAVLLLVAVLLPVGIARMSLDETMPKALLFAGLLAIYLTDIRFRQLNLWPLYANLKIARWGLLTGSAVCTLLLTLTWTLLR